MEALTQLVADSLARHGFDRPVDPRRLQWSRWFRCDSPHSLLVVPSKPGIFAISEEIMDLSARNPSGDGNPRVETHMETATPSCPAEPSSAEVEWDRVSDPVKPSNARLDLAASATTPGQRRMLAVLQFSEDDDMAFTLDRMFTCVNPMRARLASGRCFLRFVVIEDQAERRNICNALNQWMLNSAEKATGIGADFQSSLELTVERTRPEMQSKGPSPATAGSTSVHVGRTLLSDNAETAPVPAQASDIAATAPHLNSGANKNLHCPHPLPSGF
jgi:hypothetical protein